MEYNTRKEVPNEYKWDLSKMYQNESELEKDIEEVKNSTKKILEFKSHIMDSSDNFYNFLELLIKQDRILTKIYVYAALNFDVDTKDNKNKAIEYLKIASDY